MEQTHTVGKIWEKYVVFNCVFILQKYPSDLSVQINDRINDQRFVCEMQLIFHALMLPVFS